MKLGNRSIQRAEGITPRAGATNAVRTRWMRGFIALIVALGVMATGALEAAATADAATVRPGAKWGQVDVLLDSYETEKVARGLWGASVVCWNLPGMSGKVTILGICQLYLTTCAAQAYTANPKRRAGMTIAPNGFWCWKY